MKYTVLVREVSIRHYSVEAENEQLAKEAVYRGNGTDEDYSEYSHQLPIETWTVEEIKP